MVRITLLCCILAAPFAHADVNEIATLLLEQGFEEFDGGVPEIKERMRKGGIEINEHANLLLDGRYFRLHYTDATTTIGGRDYTSPQYIKIRILKMDEAIDAEKALRRFLVTIPAPPIAVHKPEIGDSYHQGTRWCAFTRDSCFILVSNQGRDTESGRKLVLNHAKLIDSQLAKR